jgi:hypothetical protein
MNKFRVVIYGIVVGGILAVASGCYEWNRGGDYSGYDRVGRSYERNDRRWDGDPFRDRGYARRDRKGWEWERN